MCNCNLDNLKFNRKFGNEIFFFLNVDYCVVNIKYIEGMELLKIVFDILDVEIVNFRIFYFVNYIDLIVKFVFEFVVFVDDDFLFWVEVGWVGLMIFVEKVR